MPRSSHVRRLGPPVALLLVGIVIGAFFVRPAGAATTLTRVASCNGFGFMPLTSTNGYTSNATRRTVGASPDIHTCALDLPNGGRVKAVRFTLHDEAPAGHVGCALRRNHLSPPDLGAESLASVAGTTETGTPGTVVRSDSSIDFPVVKNQKFSYWAECFMNNPGVGVVGVSVTYTITAAKG
jgi:hypothetical protein